MLVGLTLPGAGRGWDGGMTIHWRKDMPVDYCGKKLSYKLCLMFSDPYVQSEHTHGHNPMSSQSTPMDTNKSPGTLMKTLSTSQGRS